MISSPQVQFQYLRQVGKMKQQTYQPFIVKFRIKLFLTGLACELINIKDSNWSIFLKNFEILIQFCFATNMLLQQGLLQ